MTRLLLLASLLTPVAIAQHQVNTATGPLAAPISIVVYSDLECPYSAATLPALEQAIAQHPNQVHLDLRQFPLDIHPHSTLAHEATLAAAAQGKYLPMVDLIQANQTLMDRAQYLHYAALLHVNLPRFTHDLDTHRFVPQIQQDLAEGRALGIESTPTLFINGRRIDGAQDVPTLNDLLQKSLAAVTPATTPAPLPTETQTTTLSASDVATLALQPTALQGPRDAPITIVEFTDFQCPFCRRAEEPMRQLLAQSNGNIRWIYRSYPLDFHDHAQLAAEAALAAGDQGQFWPMHDLLFANQASLDRPHLDDFARQLHLDVARFDQALTAGTFRAQVASDRALGQRYGVDGTPFFFINGLPLSGARTVPELQQAIQVATAHPATSTPATTLAASAPTRHLLPHRDPKAASAAIVPLAVIPVDWFLDIETAASPPIGAIVQQLSTHQQVQVALHSYPLPNHPNAALAYRALIQALAQDKFWPLYAALAGHPLPTEEPAARSAILAAAQSLHLNLAPITAAFDDPQLTEDLAADKQEAYQRGIRGVPVVFIKGQRIDGIQPPSLYEAYLTQSTPTTVAQTTTH